MSEAGRDAYPNQLVSVVTPCSLKMLLKLRSMSVTPQSGSDWYEVRGGQLEDERAEACDMKSAEEVFKFSTVVYGCKAMIASMRR